MKDDESMRLRETSQVAQLLGTAARAARKHDCGLAVASPISETAKGRPWWQLMVQTLPHHSSRSRKMLAANI